MTFSDALQSAETFCEVLLTWIKVARDYLYALAQSGPSAQIFSTGRKLDTTPKAFLSMDSHSTALNIITFLSPRALCSHND